MWEKLIQISNFADNAQTQPFVYNIEVTGTVFIDSQPTIQDAGKGID